MLSRRCAARLMLAEQSANVRKGADRPIISSPGPSTVDHPSPTLRYLASLRCEVLFLPYPREHGPEKTMYDLGLRRVGARAALFPLPLTRGKSQFHRLSSMLNHSKDTFQVAAGTRHSVLRLMAYYIVAVLSTLPDRYRQSYETIAYGNAIQPSSLHALACNPYHHITVYTARDAKTSA